MGAMKFNTLLTKRRSRLRDGDDRAAECEASRPVPETPAGGEGGKTGVVAEIITMKTCKTASIGKDAKPAY